MFLESDTTSPLRETYVVRKFNKISATKKHQLIRSEMKVAMVSFGWRMQYNSLNYLK